MASFGFSVGDIILVSDIACSVYKSSRRAGDEFNAITTDIKLLRSHLRTLTDEFENSKSLVHRSSTDRKEELIILLRTCNRDLQDLKKSLSKYNSLRTDSPRVRDKFAFTPSKQADARARINTHSERLKRYVEALHTSALGRIEGHAETHEASFEEIRAKLDALHQDVLSGKRAPSLLTDMDDWVKQELIADDVTVTDVEVNQKEITAWLDRFRSQNDLERVLQGIRDREELSDTETSVISVLKPRSKTTDMKCVKHNETDNKNSSPNDSSESTPPILGGPESARQVGDQHDFLKEPAQYFEDLLPISSNPSPLGADPDNDKILFEVHENASSHETKPYRVDSNHETMPQNVSEDTEAHFELDITAFGVKDYLLSGGGQIGPSVRDIEPDEQEWDVDAIERKLPCRWKLIQRNSRHGKSRAVPTLEVPLPITLEQVFFGAEIRVCIKQWVCRTSAAAHSVEEKTQVINIAEGQESFSKVFLKGGGNQFGWGSQNLCFTIVERPHPIFMRHAWKDPHFARRKRIPDLLHVIELTVGEAFCGWTRIIHTIGGTVFKIQHAGPTNPRHVFAIENFGLPRHYGLPGWGVMGFVVSVKTPPSLTKQQTGDLFKVLEQSKSGKSVLKVEVVSKEAHSASLIVQHDLIAGMQKYFPKFLKVGTRSCELV